MINNVSNENILTLKLRHITSTHYLLIVYTRFFRTEFKDLSSFIHRFRVSVIKSNLASINMISYTKGYITTNIIKLG